MVSSQVPRLVVVLGFFDWFSGYQETVLARGLRSYADVHVVTSNWVNPIFSAENRERLGIPVCYPAGTSNEEGVSVHRLATHRPHRGMVWSKATARVVARLDPHAILLMMPGQVFPISAVSAAERARLVVVYGDNYEMASQKQSHDSLRSSVRYAVLQAAFRALKAPLYRYCNARADAIAGYTADTLEIVRKVTPGSIPELLPLGFDEKVFGFDLEKREKIRQGIGLTDSDQLIVTAGKFGRQKRLEVVVDAAATLRSQGLPVNLVLIGGDGSKYERELHDRCMHSALAGSFWIMPFLNQAKVADWYNAADVGVWPVKPAISIQQAMGTGLPVVIPRASALSHLLVADAGQWIESPVDVTTVTHGIAKALRTVDGSPDTRRRVAQGNSWLSGESLSRNVAILLGLVPEGALGDSAPR